MAISFISAGTIATGTGAINPAWGTHTTGDLGLLFVETGQEAVATPTDWTLLPATPVLAFASGRLTIFYRFATSGAESAASISDPGDHAIAAICVFRGVHATDPFTNQTAVGYAGTTSVTFPPLVTKHNGSWVVNAAAWSGDLAGPLSSAEANSSLANVTERLDGGGIDGNGGGLVVITGDDATAGEVVATTSTFSSSTAYVGATIILRPADPTPSFTCAGTVTIAGDPAPNGGTVDVYDLTLDVLETSTTIAGGAGGFTTLVKFNDAGRYQCVYNDGSSYGASAPGTPT